MDPVPPNLHHQCLAVFLGDDFRLPDLDSLTQSMNGVFGLASGDGNDGIFWGICDGLIWILM